MCLWPGGKKKVEYRESGLYPTKRNHRASCPETSEAISRTVYHHNQFDLSNTLWEMFIQIPSHVIMQIRRSSILLQNEISGILFKLWHQPILENVKIRHVGASIDGNGVSPRYLACHEGCPY
ncbi:hypothetical protein TNCV_2839211 [Trichonephila clavipes]|nr:hypothetical protein TNCV_2839211 [Trichonephila clavipes]